LGRRAMAVTADSPSLPRRELRAAAELARQRGWQHQIVETFELEDGRYAANPVDRCYFCKSALFDRLRPLSDSLGVPVCLGTNTDDLSEWRPGQRAASDRGARHPLVEAGLSKAAVREASRAIGLPCADKPAAACLASRFAYGVRVTKEGLGRIEFAEEALLGQGFSVVRVRDLGADRARVEVGREEVARLLDLEGLVRARLGGLGFAEVVLDERGYRPGALNEGLGLVAH
ncbi:MAG: ATP-dependent sacrificial sulfur transferase LarE, partial [Acidimicrobiales bacterium]